MSRTAIPELITGTISLSFFVWLAPTLASLQIGVQDMYGSIPVKSPEVISLIISAAMSIIIMALFLLIATYCLLVVAEHVICWGWEYRVAQKEKYPMSR
jgi:hypothetical protein